MRIAWLVLVAAVAGGCKDGGPAAPPEVCNAGLSLGSGPWFTDVTAEYFAGAGETVNGNRFTLADLDGDGLPDLIVHPIGGGRPDYDVDPPVKTRRVLMNRGGTHFEDVSLESGYGAARDGSSNRSAHFATAGDFDNDGDLDLVSGLYADYDADTGDDNGDRNELFMNDGTGTFTRFDGADLYVEELPWHTIGAAPLDFDRDGNLDVYLGFWYAYYGFSYEGQQDRLYVGNGEGDFNDVTDDVGLETTRSGYDEGTNHRPSYGVSACDVNDDGWPDLLGQAYGRQFNQLFVNDEGMFTDVGRTSGYAADDNIDYSDNEFYRCYCQLNPGACDPNPGAPAIPVCMPGYWAPGIDDQPWRNGGNTFSTVCGDVDNDGDLDLYNAEIRHWHIGQSSDGSQLLVNESTAGEVSFARPGVEATGLSVPHMPGWNEGGIHTAMLDFDLDGNLDIFVGFSDYPDNFGMLFRGNGDGTFEDVGVEAGVAHPCASGIAIGDIDGDGDPDLIVGSGTARDCGQIWSSNEVHIYRNDVGQDANALRLRLVGGTGSNRAAIGAKVRVTAGGKTMRRDVTGSYGHEAIGNDLQVLVGTGDACSADVEVTWPDADGTVETFKSVRANYPVDLVQAAGAVYPEI